MPKLFELLDPRPWIAVAVMAVVLFAIVQYKNAIQQVSQLKTQIAQERARAKTVALEQERRMTTNLAAIADQYQQELHDEKTKHDKFVADVRAGAVRLSVPVTACHASTSANPAAESGDRAETRAELTPEAGIALAAIAADGDDAIRQLNACIDSYQAIRTVSRVQTN